MSNASRRELARAKPVSEAPSAQRISQVWHKGQVREPETAADRIRPPVLARDRPLLFVIQGPLLGSVFAPEGATVLIGRGSHAGVIVADDTVSREHARLSFRNGEAFVEDLGSQSGTYLNGALICGKTPVTDGDQIGLGRSTLIRFSLVDRVEEQAMLTLFELTLRDPLTRAYNRRYFDRRLLEEVSFARRQGSPLSLLIIDVDHFKRVNDDYGHPVGDLVLERVASGIQGVMRPEDVLARYGGEEFVVIARHTSLNNAKVLAERIRRHVEALSMQLPGGAIQVTVSIGVAAQSQETDYSSRDELMVAVDAAMYAAKSAGRNRVCTASPLLADPRT